ncbi:MAG TPA: right-handed parallel beta-helix repeat-containing protein [Bryobacterales bacterium]|nr:right-handed parallel beta-helix repeat-containing protein [Bryobacterales bacterium]
MIRVSLFAIFIFITSIHSVSAQGKRPGGGGGGGGGGSTCPSTVNLEPITATELQTAFDCAAAGATITLQAGTTYVGNFTIRKKGTVGDAAAGHAVVNSAVAEGSSALPAGVRVSPTNLSAMPVLKAGSGSGPVLKTDPGTHSYSFTGVAFVTDHWVTPLVQLGGFTQAFDDLPDGISFDRCYFQGSQGEGSKRGLEANAGNGTATAAGVTVKHSYFEDFKDTQNDAQAIVAWNGYGPFLIENNYLEGSGENIMFGGGDPSINGLIPSNIVIRGNHFYKPEAWLTETSTQKGPAGRKKWRIKNLFELKNAQNVLVEANVFENNWIQADQRGFAIVFTPRNQSGGCGWCKVQDVTFRNNLIKDSVAGFNLLDRDDTYASEHLSRVEISNNLLININPSPFAGVVTDSSVTAAGRLFQILTTNKPALYGSPAGEMDLVVKYNTAFQTRAISFSATLKATSGAADVPISDFEFSNNVVRHNSCTDSTDGTGPIMHNNCGIAGENKLPGNDTLSYWFVSPLFVSGNVMFSGNETGVFPYPGANEFPETAAFESSESVIDQTTGLPTNWDLVDYDFLTPGPGVDWDTLLKPAITGVVQACSEPCGLIP